MSEPVILAIELLKETLAQDDIDSFFELTKKHELSLTLVGGAVRDLFLAGTISDDLDFEIREASHQTSDDQVPWTERLTRFADAVEAELCPVERLNFYVFKINLSGLNFEFSSPRTEHFEKTFSGHHSDLSCTYNGRMEYRCAFKRRDFTVNSIGIEIFNNFLIVDPLDGLQHLKDKVLVPCGEDFSKDPVRLLRLVRFQLIKGFRVSPECLGRIGEFDLSNVTAFYVATEFIKSKSKLFFKELFEYLTVYSLSVSDGLAGISFLELLKSFEGFSSIEMFIEKYLYLHDNDEQCISLCNYFHYNQKKMKSVFQFKFACAKLLMTDLSGLEQCCKTMNPESFIPDLELQNLTKVIQYYTESNLQIEYLRSLAIDLRYLEMKGGRELFIKTRKEELIAKEHLKQLETYCHLKRL